MNTADLVRLVSSGAPHVIHSDAELEMYTDVLFELTGKDSPSAAEAKVIELLDLLIEKYETEKFIIPLASPLAVLRFLMESHSLRQQDLAPQLGSMPLVSLILAGKRNLTIRHIRALSERFHVSPNVFLGADHPSTAKRPKSIKASASQPVKRAALAR